MNWMIAAVLFVILAFLAMTFFIVPGVMSFFSVINKIGEAVGG